MNILLVDDDNSSRTSLAKFLTKEGHIVVECPDGLSAIEHFSSREFHLVLTDIQMPGMSGLELLRKIREMPSGSDVDVILFTGYGDMESAVEALRAGAYDYLVKPINLEELIGIIERVSEHLTLKVENRILTQRFTEAVELATEETKAELSQLKKVFSQVIGLGNIGVFSDEMKKVFEVAKKLHADRSIPVLIEGETGTGKEVIARYIHYGDGNIITPFIDLNCGAIAPTVFESELFGYEAGAFTGGLPKGQKGKLDLANTGTLFLDEVTEIPINLQVKLLRLIQEREFYRIGGLKKIKVDVRIICATNANVKKKVEEGTFREDLYYRLNVGRIYIPPLKDRKDDIIPLAEMFLNQFSLEKKRRFKSISDEAKNILLSHDWQGNVRELKNTIEWVTLMWDDDELKPIHLENIFQKSEIEINRLLTNNTYAKQHLPNLLDIENFSLPPDSLPLEKFINNIISKAYKMNNNNKTATAKYLGLSLHQVSDRLKKIGL